MENGGDGVDYAPYVRNADVLWNCGLVAIQHASMTNRWYDK